LEEKVKSKINAYGYPTVRKKMKQQHNQP